MQPTRRVVFERFADAGAVARAAADEIRAVSAEAVEVGGRFRILLAGGTTPLAAYRLLAREPLHWAAWEVYFGDERCLPPQHPERNSHAAREALLGSVPIPAAQIFPIPAEQGAEPAAAAYAALVAGARPFDLVLLGMGADGHTASLFPGQATDDTCPVVPVHGAPKSPADRVSLGVSALADCRRMLVLVTGAGKREALRAWRAGADLPVARVARAGGARVLMDAAAAGDPNSGA